MDALTAATHQAAIASLEAPGFDVDAAVDSIRIADEREAGISEATWSDLFAMAKPMAVGLLLMTYQPYVRLRQRVRPRLDLVALCGWAPARMCGSKKRMSGINAVIFCALVPPVLCAGMWLTHRLTCVRALCPCCVQTPPTSSSLLA